MARSRVWILGGDSFVRTAQTALHFYDKNQYGLSWVSILTLGGTAGLTCLWAGSRVTRGGLQSIKPVAARTALLECLVSRRGWRCSSVCYSWSTRSAGAWLWLCLFVTAFLSQSRVSLSDFVSWVGSTWCDSESDLVCEQRQKPEKTQGSSSTPREYSSG